MHTNPHECPDPEYHGCEHWRLDLEFVAIRVHSWAQTASEKVSEVADGLPHGKL
jgi:hypothetical protein